MLNHEFDVYTSFRTFFPFGSGITTDIPVTHTMSGVSYPKRDSGVDLCELFIFFDYNYLLWRKGRHFPFLSGAAKLLESALPVVKVSDHGRHVMRSIPVPLKTRRFGSDACCRELKRPPIGVMWQLGEEVPAQVSFSSLDLGSKLRGPSPKALV
ncbi:hypothetical protein TNCV_426611 [Trichonephila clavipes]|nr:hypothetical protein TNCV_426611 [Trichonephila clavipes]